MEKLHQSDWFKKGTVRELLDDVFYVRDKLQKNRASEEEIQEIMRKIDAAFCKES